MIPLVALAHMAVADTVTVQLGADEPHVKQLTAGDPLVIVHHGRRRILKRRPIFTVALANKLVVASGEGKPATEGRDPIVQTCAVVERWVRGSDPEVVLQPCMLRRPDQAATFAALHVPDLGSFELGVEP